MARHDEALGFLDYLKAAFRWQPRLPALGRMPIPQLGLAAFGVLGLANPGFWLLGTALGVSYYVGMASNERFQKFVDAMHREEFRRGWEEQVQAALDRLRPAGRERYGRLLEECRQIVGITRSLGDAPWLGLDSARAGGLNQLLWIFLRLLASRQMVDENLDRADRKALEKAIGDLEQRIEHERSKAAGEAVGEAGGEAPAELAGTVETPTVETPLLRSLRGTLEIQRQRLANLERAVESREVIDAELARIEQQVVLMREEAAVSGKAEMLSSRLDAITGTLRETNRWMEQNAEIFGRIGVDPLGDTPDQLPTLTAAGNRETEGG